MRASWSHLGATGISSRFAAAEESRRIACAPRAHSVSHSTESEQRQKPGRISDEGARLDIAIGLNHYSAAALLDLFFMSKVVPNLIGSCE